MKITVIGGAGFIGSNLTRALLTRQLGDVVVLDNFSSGKKWHLADLESDCHLDVIEADIEDDVRLCAALDGSNLVYHFASNPDIARAATEPAIDFERGTLLTHRVLEAARRKRVAHVIYASGSGVFGDNSNRCFDEDYVSPEPTSTYAASKIAGEALLSAYCHMFGMSGTTYRFANVVGPNQTHGVGFDFVRKLRTDPTRLDVLGDGWQSKSYIYIDDVVAGLLLFAGRTTQGYHYYNLSTEDYITVREIVNIVLEEMKLSGVEVSFGASSKGWAGDVPVIRFSAEKIRNVGWSNKYTSNEAMRMAIRGMLNVFGQ